VRHLLQSLFEQIASECPKVKDEEFGELLKLNRDTFAPLVAVA
jgi:hypothetical protein